MAAAGIATGHQVTGLRRDHGGRADTVLAEGPDGPVEIRARRGILVAAGGFEGSPERRARHGTPGDAAWTMAPRGTNTGEVIDAAAAVGAATDWSGQGWFCPGLLQPDGSGSFTLGFRGGLMVDQAGQRYGNECLPYDRFGRIMAAAPERVPSWFVFDSREGGRLPAIAMPEGDPADHLAAGTWVTADTLAGLAEATGLDPAALAATIDRFNGFAASGNDDDFGRGEDEYDTFFAGAGDPNKALVPVDQPPFFAARFVLSDLGTKGGLVTDAKGRVLDTRGAPIPGLYAASNSTASVFGSAYPGPGAPLGAAMTYASLAVEDMAGS
jgi:3-oxosteroid 1-dehydrogenase